MKSLTSLTASVFCLSLLPFGAAAQSMTPMRAEVTSFSDSFAVRVYPKNPYQHRIRVEVKVYDQAFRELTGVKVTPGVFTLGAGFARPVMVIVPFEGENTRKVRICTESVPFPGQSTSVRAQVCGKYFGRKR